MFLLLCGDYSFHNDEKELNINSVMSLIICMTQIYTTIIGTKTSHQKQIYHR